jgi:4-alpha-glucanotransferase
MYMLIDLCRLQECFSILTLPIQPIDFADGAPYKPLSSRGINELLIALDRIPDILALADRGQELLREAQEKKQTARREDILTASQHLKYPVVADIKLRVLRKGYEFFRATENDTARSKDFERFIAEHKEWLVFYAQFRVLEGMCGRSSGLPQWSAELEASYDDEVRFWEYAQWEAHRQWQEIMGYAHSKGITIIGDISYFVSTESMDRWQWPQYFSNGNYSAGCYPCPGRYWFLGQLWPLALYNWPAIFQDGFSWWRKRLSYAAGLFDMLRFDCFRSMQGYWRVPSELTPEMIEAVAQEQVNNARLPDVAEQYEAIKTLWIELHASAYPLSALGWGALQAQERNSRLLRIKEEYAQWLYLLSFHFMSSLGRQVDVSQLQISVKELAARFRIGEFSQTGFDLWWQQEASAAQRRELI